MKAFILPLIAGLALPAFALADNESTVDGYQLALNGEFVKSAPENVLCEILGACPTPAVRSHKDSVQVPVYDLEIEGHRFLSGYRPANIHFAKAKSGICEALGACQTVQIAD